jgi:glyoxylase-like metal-dependent hydrolase (beta-lactamase superfamily II)
MRQIGPNVYAEMYFWGCNPGFLVTSDGVLLIDTPQQPIDAVRWREAMVAHGKPLRYLVNTEPHQDHIKGNMFFPGVEVLGQTGLQARYDALAPSFLSEQAFDAMKQDDPDSVFLLGHPDYPLNPITRTFDVALTLEMGSHTVQLIHMPGHTAPQTSVFIPEEGIVFTGDNVFHKTRTWIQEGNPWEWLTALESIRGLDVETILPGHGEPCGKEYLDVQGQIVKDWVGAIEGLIAKGVTEDEAVAQGCPPVDPYPIGQRLFPRSAFVDEVNVRNVYKQVMARKGVSV